jgi:hypothetical protein
MDFSGIFGGISSIIGAAMSARAQDKATKAQIAALKEQRQFLFDNLDPSKVGPEVLNADQTSAENRLRLQGMIDPQLLQSRYDAETKMAEGLKNLGSEQDIANLASSEAKAGVAGMSDAKKMLVDRAIQQLQLGASLPPDVQAELVRTGLEKSGMVTGAATPRGIGGTLLRKVIGSEGVRLQKQREEQAQGLLTTAQNLESNRQSILQNLFPSLARTQIGNLGAAQGIFDTANKATPQAGLSGNDVLNLWLSRVGATSSNIAKQGEVQGSGILGQGTAWAQGVSGLARGIGSTAANALNQPGQWDNAQY